MAAAQPQKRTSSVRVTEDIWSIIDKVAAREGWSRNIAIQEIVKYYAKQHDISASEKEDDNENV